MLKAKISQMMANSIEQFASYKLQVSRLPVSQFAGTVSTNELNILPIIGYQQPVTGNLQAVFSVALN